MRAPNGHAQEMDTATTILRPADTVIGVDICLDSGVDRFAIADLYFQVASEEILGKAIAGRRNGVLVSTKATFPMRNAPSSGGRVRTRREAPLECRS
jgi:aryl-alcohol dehydrogenase-like predicted oxidoreductase